MFLEIIEIGLQEYRDFVLRRLGLKRIRPWMKYKEIEIIKEILINLKPRKCLEWGAGYSTLYFPRFTDCEWIAIEHDEEWFKKLKDLINRDPRVRIYFVPPNNYPWSDPYGDGGYEDLRDYIEFPGKLGKFDFILIDGRARRYCLIKAYEVLNDYGVVVLHDANREYYHEPFKLYQEQILFNDYRKGEGGLWIGSKKLKISTVLDIEKHIKIWEFINEYLRFLKL